MTKWKLDQQRAKKFILMILKWNNSTWAKHCTNWRETMSSLQEMNQS